MNQICACVDTRKVWIIFNSGCYFLCSQKTQQKLCISPLKDLLPFLPLLTGILSPTQNDTTFNQSLHFMI